jgi:hypothetical protein
MSFVASLGNAAPVCRVASPRLFAAAVSPADASGPASRNVNAFFGAGNASSNVA